MRGPTDPQPEPFTGTARFRLVRQLGSGGMGIVFEAEDRDRSARVALKTLHRLGPHDLYRFKKEFRCLQSLVHPHLVTLYEFISDRGHWFFTMELVEGQDFLSYVRGLDPNEARATASIPAGHPVQPLSSTASSGDPPAGEGPETADPLPNETVQDATASLPGPGAASTAPGLEAPPGRTDSGWNGPRHAMARDPSRTAGIDADRTGPAPGEPSRASDRPQAATGIDELASATFAGRVAAGSAAEGGAEPGPACDLRRLLDVLEQMAEGLHVLHEAGMLHRDLKPSNVLVTAAGRVVILDFGLITEVDAGTATADRDLDEVSSEIPDLMASAIARARTDQGLIVGTIRYMAPEQAAGRSLTRAADWYSFGVILYEALVGESPFSGTASEILEQKRSSAAIPPDRRRPGIPAVLSALCVELLRSHPADRPAYAEIVARLRREGPPATDAPAPTPAPPAVRRLPTDHPFVGRETELGRLRAAYQELGRGQSVIALVHGPSGSGKSCLIQRFLDQDLDPRRDLILRGRCFEQESVPFKAVDHLIDALSRYLIGQPEEQVSRVLPADVAPLARMFPVLERVGAIAVAADPRALPPDPLELRRRAFGALRRLLAGLGGLQPVVLWIDDIQWGDLDSAELLAELLRGPDPPRLLLLASYRSEYEAANPCLRVFSKADDSFPGGALVRRIEVGPLAPDDAERLAAGMLREFGREGSTDRTTIARESAGNPYWITELARHILAESGSSAVDPAGGGVISLPEMVWARIQRLPGEARRLLEVIAVTGRPLPQRCAYLASRLDVRDQAALALLRTERLVRSAGPGLADKVEVYHDQIRESLLDRLSAEAQCQHHRRLAVELEAMGGTDPERLAVHFARGDQPERAGRYYRQAALQASRALAFDRAVSLYRRALELGHWPPPTAGRLQGELGDALANSRRGREAGQVYLEAAAGVPPLESIELRRRGFQQLLTAGAHDQGLEVLRRVYQAVGLSYPETPGRALGSAALGLARLRLRLRGLGFRPRPEYALDDDELMRLDVGWSAGMSLCLIDSARAAPILIDNLHRSLRAGEPLRAARSLLAVSGLLAVRGRQGLRRCGQLLRQAEPWVGRIDDPNVLALYHSVRGLAAYSQGRWSLALELHDQSQTVFRGRCTGVTTSLEMAAYYSLRSLCWLGRFAELRRRRRALLAEAIDRQDLFSMTNYRTEVMTYDLLAEDDPAGAAHEIEAAMGRWSQRGFHAQHLFALVASLRVDLYPGRGLVARRRIQDAWQAYRGSQLHRSCIARINIDSLIAAGSLASWSDHASRASLEREASRAARRLESERIDYASAVAATIRGRLASLRGDRSRAIRIYRRTAEWFRRLEMPLYSAATTLRLGELLPPEEGMALVQEAVEWLESQQVRDPDAMIRMVLP